MSASSDSDNDGNDEDSIVFRLFGVVDLVEGFFGLRPVDPFTGPVMIRKQRSLAMRARHGYNKHLNIYIYIYICTPIDSQRKPTWGLGAYVWLARFAGHKGLFCPNGNKGQVRSGER